MLGLTFCLCVSLWALHDSLAMGYGRDQTEIEPPSCGVNGACAAKPAQATSPGHGMNKPEPSQTERDQSHMVVGMLPQR